MAKVYWVRRVETILTASDITYQAVNIAVFGLSGRNCRDPVPALLITTAERFDVWRLRLGKRSFLFVYQKQNKITPDCNTGV